MPNYILADIDLHKYRFAPPRKTRHMPLKEKIKRELNFVFVAENRNILDKTNSCGANNLSVIQTGSIRCFFSIWRSCHVLNINIITITDSNRKALKASHEAVLLPVCIAFGKEPAHKFGWIRLVDVLDAIAVRTGQIVGVDSVDLNVGLRSGCD